jgi:hypothetical protein
MKKVSKHYNRVIKTYCNFYWGKYVKSGMMKEVSFEKYLTMCHLF